MWIYIITAFICFFCSIYYYFSCSSKHKYFKNLNIDGPKPGLIGNTPSYITQSRNVTYEIDDIYQEFKSKSRFVGYFEFKTPKFLILDPKLVQTVLVKNFKNFHDNEFSKMTDKDKDPIIGRNPFMLRGEEWKEKRAEITPAFTLSRIRALFPLVEEVNKKLVKYINDEIDSKLPLDAREVSAKYTTDVVSNCIFAVDAQSFTQDAPKIREMGRKIMQTTPFMYMVYMLYSVIPSLMKIYKIKMVSKEIEEFFTNLMKEALDYREKNNITRNDYLEYLIELKKKKQITTTDMAAHGVSFFLDGFETSSITIASCLYELGNNKEVQMKLRGELKTVYDDDGKIIYEKLLENAYLDQVFHETLRLHPQLTIINRECTEPIEIDGFKFEKDMSFNIPVYSIHRDPVYYSDPVKFKPERFDAEHGGIKAFRDKCVFLPFGDGPRMCLGLKFALMQSKAAIAEIVRNFEITVDPKTILPLVIDPKQFMNIKIGGLWLNFKSVEKI